MNKLSLVGMQLPEEYKENLDISSEGPSSGVTPVEGSSPEMLKFSLYFSGSCIPTNESLFILLALPTLAQTVRVNRDLTILGRQRDGDGQNKLLQINGSKDSSWYIINRMNLIQF